MKWKGFGAIAIEEARPRGREDVLNPCTERATHCKKHTFNCKYRINLANLVAIPYLKLCWTYLADLGTIGLEWFWLVVGCISLFLLVLVRFKLLQILVQSIDLFYIPIKIHTMVLKIKQQNNFIFSSLVT